MPPRQTAIHRVSVDGRDFDLKDQTQYQQLAQSFAGFFGIQVEIWDLIDVFESDSTKLMLDTLRIVRRAPDLFETRAEFSRQEGRGRGHCVYVWKRHADGSLERSAEASMHIEGSRGRLALQLHANLATFAQRAGLVSQFSIRAREVGRYAYRFLDGVQLDAETLHRVGLCVQEVAGDLDLVWSEAHWATIQSPHDVAAAFVLYQVPERWMATVDAIIKRQGYQFTLDQVLDVARRPGLAFLIDQRTYTMNLDLDDAAAMQRFYQSVSLGRRRRTLQRVRGILGSPFRRLPREVRRAVIAFRPYLFPPPYESPNLPDLSSLVQPPSPRPVRGFRCEDNVLLPPQAADPPGTSLGDYRLREVQQVLAAIDAGLPLVTVTGLSGSGKTESMIWNLEKRLSALGLRAASIDARSLARHPNCASLLTAIDDSVRPRVMIFDESLYIRSDAREDFLAFARRFLKWPGQFLILVGGGRISPEAQHQAIEQELEELWQGRESRRVTLMPKAVNLEQAYRFMGLARIEWLSTEQKIELLQEVMRLYPPFFVPLVPLRFHEQAGLKTYAQALQLVHDEANWGLWQQELGMEWATKSAQG